MGHVPSVRIPMQRGSRPVDGHARPMSVEPRDLRSGRCHTPGRTQPGGPSSRASSLGRRSHAGAFRWPRRRLDRSLAPGAAQAGGGGLCSDLAVRAEPVARPVFVRMRFSTAVRARITPGREAAPPAGTGDAPALRYRPDGRWTPPCLQRDFGGAEEERPTPRIRSESPRCAHLYSVSQRIGWAHRLPQITAPR
jgi:hypothetical protein